MTLFDGRRRNLEGNWDGYPEIRTEKGRDRRLWIVRASRCSECGEELGKGRSLRMEGDRPLCLSCADLDHLFFLPRGDAALTRRAGKYSTLKAVVVRFSRARKRHERQGILVEKEALERAEKECLQDAEVRALRRQREAERRADLDVEFVREFVRQVRKRYPRCPAGEARKIAEQACLKYSGRVGRSQAAKRFEPQALDLAVAAHLRHRHSDYDRLLAEGRDRFEARREVGPSLANLLERWSGCG